MSDEEKQKLKLNCLTDFQRAAVAYFTNPKGKTCLIFFDHGIELLRILGKGRLIKKAELIYKKLLRSKKADSKLAEDILTLGLLAKPV